MILKTASLILLLNIRVWKYFKIWLKGIISVNAPIQMSTAHVTFAPESYTLLLIILEGPHPPGTCFTNK